MIIFKKNTTQLFLALLALFSFYLFSCSPPPPINDFFGIKMNPEMEKKFKIISYSEDQGASYATSVEMDANVYAYAELTGKNIIVKIVNESDQPIPSNFNSDQFILHLKDGKTYTLKKGKLEDYPINGYIQPSSSVQYTLLLPSDFWETVGMRNPNSQDADYRQDFWTGLNKLRFLKGDVNYIEINLGGVTTLILKPLPVKK